MVLFSQFIWPSDILITGPNVEGIEEVLKFI